MNKTKIGITGTGSLIGQAIIKSILHSSLREKIYMIGFDYFKDTVGSYWTDNNFVLPDFLRKDITEEMWVEGIIKYLNLENITLLFIGIDFELKLFSKYKRDIESKTQCKVLVSNPEVIQIADDKYLTYNFLKNNGLYYPQTSLFEDFNGSFIKFPCILKPRFGWGSRNVFVVENMEDLRNKVVFIQDPILQELIEGRDNEYTCGVIFLNNSLKEMISLRRDLINGTTTTAYFSKDIPSIIYKYISDVANILKPLGACNFQLRVDNSGIPKLFEINARHSGTTFMRSLFGFCEVEYILAYLLGLELKSFSLKPGMVKRYYDEIFIGVE